MQPTGKTTNQDVARAAGVSVATVSYVLNNKGSVGAETRKRVLEAMSRLGYQPNPHATRLRRSATLDHPATNNVGVAWTNKVLSHRIHADNLVNQGVSQQLESRGYHAVVTYGDEDRIFSPSFFGKIDALIVAGTPHAEVIATLPQRMPIISTNTLIEDLPIPAITVDDRHVGRMVGRYLADLGHRRMAFINPVPLHPYFKLRQTGFEEILRERDLLDPELIRVRNPDEKSQVDGIDADVEHFSVDDLMEPLMSLSASKRPTAVFAPNDETARAVYRFCHGKEMLIPRDLSVVGCDNDPGICLSLIPALTTVELPFAEMGRRAAEMVLQALEKRDGGTISSITFLRGKMIERASCCNL